MSLSWGREPRALAWAPAAGQEGPALKLLETVALSLDIQYKKRGGRGREREERKIDKQESLLFRILLISKSNFSDQPYVTL